MVDHVEYQKIVDDALDIFHNGFACSESVMYALRKNFGWEELSDDVIAMTSGFPWGLGGAGCLCGAVASGSISLGYMFGRRTPGEPVTRCHQLTNEFADAVREKFGATCCGKLIAEFPDRDAAPRKAKCSEIVSFCARTAAEIIVRETGISAS